MKIQVTKEDIAAGQRKHAYQCPIAKACQREFKSINVSVGLNTVYINDKSYRLPGIASDFRWAFDNCEPYSKDGFEFELTV